MGTARNKPGTPAVFPPMSMTRMMTMGFKPVTLAITRGTMRWFSSCWMTM
jgi:hypothetical protein